jgi:hypothetical protein
MHNLFFCFLSLTDKQLYLTINLIDVVISFLYSGLFPTRDLFPISIYSDRTLDILIICFLIAASISLFLFFYRNEYKTIAHKAYMVLRSFLVLILCIYYIRLIFNYFDNSYSAHDNVKIIFTLIFYGFLAFLNIFWSYLNVVIIN